MAFMPVVLAAGIGSRISNLTSHYAKALLPVGNYPLVYYPLAMLQRHGFTEAIIVVPRSYETEIRETLLERCGLKIKLMFESIPDTQLGDLGTAETLRLVRNKIPASADILIVSGDLITDLDLSNMFNMYRRTNATLTMLLSTVKESRDLPVPGLGKAKQEKEDKHDVIGISEKDNRLLHMDSVDDVDEEMELPLKALLKYPEMRMRSTMTDCHLYLLRRWTLDYLVMHRDCERMTSVKQDLLPHLVRKQFASSKQLKKSRTWADWNLESKLDEPNRLAPPTKDNDIYAFAEITRALDDSKKYMDMAEDMTAGFYTELDSPEFYVTQDNDVIRCYAYVQDSGFCVRTNTYSAYCEANSQISKYFPVAAPQSKGFISQSVRVPKTTQVGPDCFIGCDCKIGEKVVMKKSAVGTNCVLQDKAKIANSIIMDKVKAGESSIVMNSIVCSGVVLGDKCEIKDSIVSPSMNIQPLSKHNNEFVSSDADRLMDD